MAGQFSFKLVLLAAIAACSLLANVAMWLFIQAQPPALQEVEPEIEYADSSSKNTSYDLNIQNFLHQGVAEKNYSQLSESLLELGLPMSMVKRLILSYLDLDDELADTRSNDEYWRFSESGAAGSVAQTLESDAIKRQKLIDIFGESVKDDPAFYALFRPYQKTLGFLSSEKQLKLQELQLEMIANPAKRNPSAYESSVELILGPTDYREYRFRESMLAKTLLRELQAFEYSEQDYREIYKIKERFAGESAVSGQSALLSGADFNLNGLSKKENPAENEAIRTYLGEERYQDYLLSKNPAFRTTLDITKSHGIDKSTAMSAYEILNDAKLELTGLYQNAGLSGDQINVQVNSLITDASHEISTLVGYSVAEKLVSEVLKKPRLYR
ncbi:MAG TPA: hypothetical protein VF268_08190 [Gammaproteobacteria bacterium]